MSLNEQDLNTVRIWAVEMTDDEVMESLMTLCQRESEILRALKDDDGDKEDYMRNLAALIAAQSKFTKNE